MAPPSNLDVLPLLTSVLVVCREIPLLAQLTHVASSIDHFLDPGQRVSIARACVFPSLALVKRIVIKDAREPIGSMKRDPMFRQWQFSTGLPNAIATGDMELVQWLVMRFHDCEIPAKAVAQAEFYGRLDILKWLRAQGCRLRAIDADVQKALMNNHKEVAIWLNDLILELGTNSSDRELWPGAAILAANGGYLDVVKWLHNNRFDGCSSNAIDNAAAEGHLHVVQWLHDNTFEGCTTAEMDQAAANGHLEVIKWLHEFRSEGSTTKAMDGGASSGHLQVVKWLDANRSEGCTVRAMDGAATAGHLDVVQWLDARRVEGCTTAAKGGAAKNGNLNVVQWLHLNHDEGCTIRAMTNAAALGHFDVVLFLHRERTEGCNVNAVKKAYSNRHDEYLSWFEKNYPVSYQQARVEPYTYHGTPTDIFRRMEGAQALTQIDESRMNRFQM